MAPSNLPPQITPKMVRAARVALHEQAGDDIGLIADEEAVILSILQDAFDAAPSSSRMKDRTHRGPDPRIAA